MNYIMWKNMLNLVFKLISELELKSIQIDKQTNKQTKNNNATHQEKDAEPIHTLAYLFAGST